MPYGKARWSRSELLKGSQVAAIRKHRGWSQQYLAIQSGVNKAYISEYESGVRLNLPTKMLGRIEAVLFTGPDHWTPRIKENNGRPELVLEDQKGKKYVPPIASVQWTDKDGNTHSIFLGAIDSA
jgi:transcriptional regulator with XRE-family HTH domain